MVKLPGYIIHFSNLTIEHLAVRRNNLKITICLFGEHPKDHPAK